MLANFGFGALIITFLVALYGIGAAIFGAVKNSTRWVESARLRAPEVIQVAPVEEP